MSSIEIFGQIARELSFNSLLIIVESVSPPYLGGRLSLRVGIDTYGQIYIYRHTDIFVQIDLVRRLEVRSRASLFK